MEHLLVLFALLVVGQCDLSPRYSAPSPPSLYGAPGPVSCGPGLFPHADGSCVTPEVMNNVFVYTVPALPKSYHPPPHIPKPKLENNILFVRLPEEERGPGPVVVPPPRQNNVVYVLRKRPFEGGPEVIHVPAPPKSNPEVFFIDYGEGENPVLPNGLDLQTALSSNAQHVSGQVIGGGGGGGGFIGGGGGGLIGGGGGGGGFIGGGGGGLIGGGGGGGGFIGGGGGGLIGGGGGIHGGGGGLIGGGGGIHGGGGGGGFISGGGHGGSGLGITPGIGGIVKPSQSYGLP